MNKLRLIISALAVMLCLGAFAQEEMSEKDKKKLQKELLSKAKGMDPLELQKMFNEYPNMSSEISSLNSQVSDLQSQLSNKENRISELEAELEAARNTQPTMSSGDSSGTSEGGSSTTSSRPSSSQAVPGLVYKVQIGAFRDKDLTKYLENNENFSGEVDQDGTKKYTIGQFKEYWEADTFKKYMREMGVKDAWIVPYYNGKRISMKDAREGVF